MILSRVDAPCKHDECGVHAANLSCSTCAASRAAAPVLVLLVLAKFGYPALRLSCAHSWAACATVAQGRWHIGRTSAGSPAGGSRRLPLGTTPGLATGSFKFLNSGSESASESAASLTRIDLRGARALSPGVLAGPRVEFTVSCRRRLRRQPAGPLTRSARTCSGHVQSSSSSCPQPARDAATGTLSEART